MKKFSWLYLVVAVLCLIGLIASGCAKPEPGEKESPTPGEEEYITYTGDYTGTEYKWLVGEKVEGMKAGEEDLYFEWEWSIGSKWDKAQELDFVCEELMVRTKGHWKIIPRYGGILASSFEAPFLVGAGTFEMCYSYANYFPAEMPCGSISNLPYWTPTYDPEASVRLQWYECVEHPLAVADHTKLNLYCSSSFGVQGSDTYHLWPRKGSGIRTLEDMQGKPARATGYHAVVFKEAGLVPLNMGMPAQVESLQKGIIEVAEYHMIGGKATGLWEFTDIIIMFPKGFGGYSSAVYMELDAWNGLPEYLRNTYDELIRPTTVDWWLKAGAERKEESITFFDEAGLERVFMSEEDETEWRKGGTAAFQAYSDFCTIDLKMGEKHDQFMRDIIAFRNKLVPDDPWTIWNP